MPEGTISPEEFYTESMAFLELWDRVDASPLFWQWEPRADSMAKGFLRLDTVPMSIAGKEIPMHDDDPCPDESNGFIDSMDAAEVAWESVSSQRQATMTYHVVYSAVYEVPILYFRGYGPDGNLLSLLDLKKFLTTQAQQTLRNSPWTFISQEEHPFLHRPWFTFHPCGTSSMMSMIFNQQHSSGLKDHSPSEARFRCDQPGLVNPAVVNAGTDGCDKSLEAVGNASSGDGSTEILECKCSSTLGGRYLSAWLSIVGPLLHLEVPLDLFKQACNCSDHGCSIN